MQTGAGWKWLHVRLRPGETPGGFGFGGANGNARYDTLLCGGRVYCAASGLAGELNTIGGEVIFTHLCSFSLCIH